MDGRNLAGMVLELTVGEAATNSFDYGRVRNWNRTGQRALSPIRVAPHRTGIEGRGIDLTESIAWVGVDWGTSNLRAWGIADSGAVVAHAHSDQGMGKLAREQFPDALGAVLSEMPLPARPCDVVICGMAGARQGWLEAPYLEAPTDLSAIGRGAVRPDIPNERFSVSILPGVCQRAGGENVMRGEETQLLGLASLTPGYAGLVCMPGTHSKWARLEGTRIAHFFDGHDRRNVCPAQDAVGAAPLAERPP